MLNEISKYRNKIDQIDDKIINLILDRVENVKIIGKVKQQQGILILDVEREKKILDRLNSIACDTLTTSQIELIFKNIFKLSREIQLTE